MADTRDRMMVPGKSERVMTCRPSRAMRSKAGCSKCLTVLTVTAKFKNGPSNDCTSGRGDRHLSRTASSEEPQELIGSGVDISADGRIPCGRHIHMILRAS
jgi:hypothetical protein